ncbi:MAG: VanZ family protein [Candidatus Izimaplasma sp.]|nr:VanZ family protein [Candidatus Izimaplasma bacterium]
MKQEKWGMVGLWMVIIFLFSHQSGSASTESSNVIAGMIEWLIPNLRDDKFIELFLIEHVREIAHIFLYFGLGIITYRALEDQFRFERIGYTVAIGIGYAILDEFHQIYVPGRAFQVIDLLHDTLGLILSILVFEIVKHIVIKDDKNETIESK